MGRRAGDELAQSVEVAYDGAGRPVSYTDQDGRAKKFERDAFGRVAKEIFPDASEVVYAYDGAGRLESVLDENRHRIQFGWDAQGLASRTTAAGQVTDYVRDDYGLLKEVVSSRGGRAERTVKREYDKFDRPVKVVYGPREAETFAYDAWGRLAKRTRGKKTETYAYDHFGRLVEKAEDGVTTSYAYDAWGQRTRRVTKDAEGKVLSEETRTYDRHGRLAEIASGGKSVTYAYDRAGRVSRQVVDGRTIAYEYTRYGRLAAKTLLGVDGKTAELRYRYGKDGKIASRRANGVLQNYAYDAKGQLVAVTGEDGTVAERYVYDPAGNILEKEVGGKVTKYRYDGANQLVSSTAPDGTVTKYAYDAAGRLVKEGAKTYRYGYLDKVLSVIDGRERRTFTYHVDGQLATATYDGPAKDGIPSANDGPASGKRHSCRFSESFLWDGLALIRRGSTSYVNEPHPNGGSPILSSADGVMFNDVLGTTLGADGAGGYAAASLTSFGDPAPGGPRSRAADALFTGKPHVDGLGYAFLFRNYRSGLGKWMTADPLGYPDGWNRLAYGNNSVLDGFDCLGAAWTDYDMLAYYYRYDAGLAQWIYGQVVAWFSSTYDTIDTDFMDLTDGIWGHITGALNILNKVRLLIIYELARIIQSDWHSRERSGNGTYEYRTGRSYDFKPVVWALGDGTVRTYSRVDFRWSIYETLEGWKCTLGWSSYTHVNYFDSFVDPTDVSHYIGINVEAGGVPYSYHHEWLTALSKVFTFRLE